jgi:hypothetical protein
MLGWMTPRTTTALTFHLRITLQAQQDLAPALVIHGIRDCKKLSFNPQSLSTSLSPSLPQFLSPFVSPFFFQQVQPPTTLSFLDIPGAWPVSPQCEPDHGAPRNDAGMSLLTVVGGWATVLSAGFLTIPQLLRSASSAKKMQLEQLLRLSYTLGSLPVGVRVWPVGACGCRRLHDSGGEVREMAWRT